MNILNNCWRHDAEMVPVLFLIFNRPGNTAEVFAAISDYKPKQLFIAADGPRADDEKAICEQTRQIVKNIDWDCDVKTLFRDINLGCKKAVSEGIKWFFDHVEEGIILEDDCVPDATFFPFCTELLEKYRLDTRVMSISGSNLLGRPWQCETQSYFWGLGGVWGWATWKRAWQLYDIDMKDWHKPGIKEKIKNNIGTKEWFNTFYSLFESSANNSLDTWDIQWFYTILSNDGLAINPCVNLVKNIGFDTGTHTHSKESVVAVLTSNSITFPLKDPKHQVTDVEYLELLHVVTNLKSSDKVSFLKKAIQKILG